MSVFKLMRIVVLLSIFFVILAGTWMNERRLANWERPIWVTVYPILADNVLETEKYVKRVRETDFEDINAFLERSLRPYGVSLTPPLKFQLAPVSYELPPKIPERHSYVSIGLWSLKMRWWSWRMMRKDGLISPDIQMFVLYHTVGLASEMNVSVGMRKGMYGLVKAYAGVGMHPRNQVVIAHELLHVLGATDKYAMGTGNPDYPFGFAEPDKQPLFPQTYAEIMGGRIPLSAFESVMPDSLNECRIGRKTAEEIGLFARLQQD